METEIGNAHGNGNGNACAVASFPPKHTADFTHDSSVCFHCNRQSDQIEQSSFPLISTSFLPRISSLSLQPVSPFLPPSFHNVLRPPSQPTSRSRSRFRINQSRLRWCPRSHSGPPLSRRSYEASQCLSNLHNSPHATW